MQQNFNAVIYLLMERKIKSDKAGELFEIGFCDTDYLRLLLDMYCFFTPKPASQGLPPCNTDVCCNWVKRLFEIGRNYLAFKNGRVVAHAALLPAREGGSAEFIIFVHQDHRNLGIGTELMRFVLDDARQLGLLSIWLTVETSNLVAIKLYRNFGFQFCDMDPCERTMLLAFQK